MLNEDAILALACVFSLLMCFSMGANDESMASAYGAKAFTLRNAIIVAAITEVLGAVLLGSEVTMTIQGKLFSSSVFEGEAPLLMLGLLCALVGTSSFLSIASKLGWPVSTTHGIIGAICGVAMAAKGADVLNVDKVVEIIVSWVISPVVGGAITLIIFLILELAIFKRQEPYKQAKRFAPVFYGFGMAITFAFVLFKGISQLKSTPWYWLFLGCIGAGLAAFGLIGFVILPRLIPWIENDSAAPLDQLLTSFLATKIGQSRLVVRLKSLVKRPTHQNSEKASKEAPQPSESELEKPTETTESSAGVPADAKAEPEEHQPGDETNEAKKDNEEHKIEMEPPSNPAKLEGSLTYGPRYTFSEEEILSVGQVELIEVKTPKYDKRVQKIFVLLQMFTSTLVCFARGANDVSNGIGPFTAILSLWKHGEEALTMKQGTVDIWVLIIGGVAMAAGLAALGRFVIKNVGENITKLLPSHGVTIEVGTSLTVLMCSKLGLPVSSTHTLVGCVVAIGLYQRYLQRFVNSAEAANNCSSDSEKVNWKNVGKVALSWVITIPATGGVSALLYVCFRPLY